MSNADDVDAVSGAAVSAAKKHNVEGINLTL